MYLSACKATSFHYSEANRRINMLCDIEVLLNYHKLFFFVLINVTM